MIRQLHGRPRPVLIALGTVVAVVLAGIAGQAGAATTARPIPRATTSATGTTRADEVGVFGAKAVPLAGTPADQPARGMVYGGLIAARSGRCRGGYQMAATDPPMCTHGPDAPPSGLDVATSVPPVGPPAVPAAATGLVCDGDGVSGRRVEVLYIHGSTDRYTQYLETFRTITEGVDTIYNESAKETGGQRHVRFVTESVGGLCRATVRNVTIPDAALTANDLTPLYEAINALGYTRTDRKYLEFVDAAVYCGMGTFVGDTTKSDANLSNGGPHYARVDSGCWTAGVAAHELGHNFGAVNNDAPNSSKGAHCTDEFDVMCYQDAPGVVMTTKCPDVAHDTRLDCNHDDYYSTDPAPGSYLAKSFNVADNLFLIK